MTPVNGSFDILMAFWRFSNHLEFLHLLGDCSVLNRAKVPTGVHR
jgi:hypothetical protein